MVTLEPGDKAPAFTGTDQDGNRLSLADFRNKKLLLYFYPEDDTPTCTIQACNLRDNFSLLKKAGIEVLGVSPDPAKSHKRFESKYGLPFRLLSDTGHQVLEKYGVWDRKKLFGHEYMGVLRTSFLIDEKGRILQVFKRPKNKMHAQEVLASLKTDPEHPRK